MNKILTASFVLGALAFSSVNAEEIKEKQTSVKTQQKMNMKNSGKEDFMNKMFKEMDKDNDGFVTKKEHKEYLEKRFNELDKNKDGVLTEDEFVIKNKKAKKENKGDKKGECPYRGEKAFKSLDKNGDGKITKKEFVKAQQKNFKEMDKNDDGKISYEEFSGFKEEKMKAKKDMKKKEMKKETKAEAKK